MALQWLILSYVVAAEVVIAVILTLPYPMLLKKRIVSLVSLILQPAASIVAFAGFQLLGDNLSLSIYRRSFNFSPFLVRGIDMVFP